MENASVDIVDDGWGGTYFKDTALERAYYTYSISQSLAASNYTPWIAATLFIASSPFDIVLIGNFEFSNTVVQCLALRAATVCLLVLSGAYMRLASPKAKSITLIFGWCLSVGVIWYLAMQTTPMGAVFYIWLLGLASISTISLLPVLSFWQIRFMNSVLLLPIIVIAVPHWRTSSYQEVAFFMFSGILLLSTIFMGLYSQRSYELAMRADFLRSRDLAVARDTARKADQTKTDFLASVSHELRTPLNAIQGNLQLIAKSRALEPEEREMVADARKASDTMIAMVSDLLKVNNVAIGSRTSVSDIRLGDLIADIEAVISVLVKQKSLRLELPSENVRDCWVRVDAENLCQLLLNLLGNSVKFTRHGHVGLRLRVNEHKLRFIVYDSGIGMMSEQMRHAFEPFFRGSSPATGDFPGTGLGLAIVERLVAESGGAIRLRSQLNKGTVVAGWLPAKIVSPGPERDLVFAPVEIAPMRVLVVEDDPASMAVLTRMLEQAGHSIFAAKTGLEAVELFEKHPPHCVMSDIRLPDIDGLELLKRLTAVSQPDEVDAVSFFAVTANAFPDDVACYVEAGFDGVISKPFDEVTLLNCLAGVAATKQMMTALKRQHSDHGKSRDPASSEKHLYVASLRECLKLLGQARSDKNSLSIEAIAHRVRGSALVFGDIATANDAWALEFREGFDDDTAIEAAEVLEASIRSVLIGKVRKS